MTAEVMKVSTLKKGKVCKMVLAAIGLSSMMCGIHLMCAGFCLAKYEELGVVVNLILGAISGFITYTLFTFGG